MVRRTFRFTEAEREQVLQAVQKAESSTSGEIVPCIAGSSGDYAWVHAALAVLGLAWATLALSLVHRDRIWDVHLGQTLLWQLVGLLAGFALSWIPAIRRSVIPKAVLAREVDQKSYATFVQAKLTDTAERNGVLVFISLFERRVEILADRGIHERVPPGYWEERVREIVDGVHRGRPIEALCLSIGRIGEILAEKFPSQGGGRNELPDELRET